MVKQYRSDGTEIRDGESAVPGYTPFHLRDLAHEEGSEPPPAKPDDFWTDLGITPPPAELSDAEDPGDPWEIEEPPPAHPTLTYLQASENNIERVVSLVQSHLCHDQDYKPLTPREQVSVLILAVNRIVWTDMQSKPKE